MMKEHKSDCRGAQPYYFDYLAGQNSDESAPGFEHIARCPQCQEEIRRLEKEIGQKTAAGGTSPRILALHHQHLSQWIDCEAVKPFLASLAYSELSLQAKTPITIHISHCPLCQKDLQAIVSLGLSDRQLTEATRILTGEACEMENLSTQAVTTMQAIRDRKLSDIITRLEIDAEGEIRIGTKHRPQAVSVTRSARGRFITRFAAAAAIMLVVSLVLFKTTTASGVSLQNVYRIVNSIVNCRIQINIPEQNNPIQTILISKELNLVAYQQDGGTVLLDTQRHTVFYPEGKNRPVSTESEQAMWSKISQIGFGMLPFETIRQIPAGHVWKQRPDLPRDASCKIYDLTWKESTETGILIEKTWRGYLLNSSCLPVRIQWLEKRPGQAEKIIMEAIIQYPDTATIRKDLEANPLYHLFEGDQIK
jgi:hypothetical protein